MRNLSVAALTLCAAFLAGCSDSSGPKLGPLTTIAIKAGGDNQSALAGTVVSGPIILTPTDDQGHTIPEESATFAVIAGGGTLANTTGTVNSDGTITAPAWTLGKSVVPQQLQVTIAGKTTVINATVQTHYLIDLRFFGITPADDQQLFRNAAARIEAIVVGQLPPANLAGADPAQDCGVTGVAPLTSADIANGVIIYASVDSIDAAGDTVNGNILAQSFPCFVRSNTDLRTVIGVMSFDSADIKSLAGSGSLQDVITHEMLHVVGFGSFWDSTGDNLLINDGSPNVAYTGPGGIAGCKAIGGSAICTTSVPVEGTQGGDGTIGSHWRESTFCNELMTGFLNRGTNPLSTMTIQSLQDLGYGVNPAAADPYTIQTNCPTSNFRASFRLDDISVTATPGAWERGGPHPPRPLPSVGAPSGIRSHK
jgi:hypothetical protein